MQNSIYFATASEIRIRSGTDLDTRARTNMPRSRSEKSLKNSEQGIEDKLTILSQMFWIAVSLLESDYEYEFLLATRLLDKVELTYFCVPSPSSNE